jgi:hypothetical protein
MLSCGETIRAARTYFCSDCSTLVTYPFTCHSRICSRCGKKYAERFGEQLIENYFAVAHRHMVFTIPIYLHLILKRGETWDYLDAMLHAAFEAIEEMYRKRFPRSRVIPGMIAIIHTTGRGLKFNPHIHMLLTEGGLNPLHNCWVDRNFLHYHVLSRIWQVILVSRFKSVLEQAYPIKNGEYWKARGLLDRAVNEVIQWKSGPKKGMLVKSIYYTHPSGGRSTAIPPDRMYTIGSYLARYIRHPPIGDSRIFDFDGVNVGIRYEWDGVMGEKTVDLSGFMKALVWNIPPPHFRVVRYRGLYAPVNRKKYWRKMVWAGRRRLIGGGLKPGQKHLILGPCCKRCGGQLEFLWGHYTTIDGRIMRYGI